MKTILKVCVLVCVYMETTLLVCACVGSISNLRLARVEPLSLLFAMSNYERYETCPPRMRVAALK